MSCQPYVDVEQMEEDEDDGEEFLLLDDDVCVMCLRDLFTP